MVFNQRKMKTPRVILSCLFLALLVSGCAFGVTNVRVAHSPLESVPQKRGGEQSWFNSLWMIGRKIINTSERSEMVLACLWVTSGFAMANASMRWSLNSL